MGPVSEEGEEDPVVLATKFTTLNVLPIKHDVFFFLNEA